MTPAPPVRRANETVSLDDNPLDIQSEEEPSIPPYEEPSEVSAPPMYEPEAPAFESGEEPPSYEDNADYEQPAPIHGAIPDEDQEIPDLPAESTRSSIDPSEENNE